jgi:REP element-mobilizing transposase RayT
MGWIPAADGAHPAPPERTSESGPLGKKEHTVKKLSDRKHPLRLPTEVYAELRLPIFATCRVKPGTRLIVPELAKIALDTLFAQGDRWLITIHAYCLMPDHMHFVCMNQGADDGFQPYLAGFKRDVSRRAHQAAFPVFAWQRSYWDNYPRNDEDVKVKIQYTLDNPVRKGLCGRTEDWPWSAYLSWPG